MPDLSPAPKDIIVFVRQVTEDFEPQLIEAGVTVGVLMALATDKEHDSGEPPPFLKHNGYPCAATVERNSLKQRLKGTADATVTIDNETWRGMDDAERVSLVHHEIHHLEVCRAEDGSVELDKANRPKLNMRLHDIVIGGFKKIIATHGLKSVEAVQLRDLYASYEQKLMSWMSDVEPQDEVPEGEEIAGVIGR